jgi:hypothetical protein
VFVFRQLVFEKSLSKLFCICLSLEKLVNEKHFLVKRKFSLISRKVFSFYFWQKTLSESCEKFRNVILFVDYIKFDPQTFDCYFFFLNIFFQFHPLEFNFYINFDLIFIIVICFSFIIFQLKFFIYQI